MLLSILTVTSPLLGYAPHSCGGGGMNAVTSLHSTADMPGASVVWLTTRDFILFENLWGALQKVDEQAGRIALDRCGRAPRVDKPAPATTCSSLSRGRASTRPNPHRSGSQLFGGSTDSTRVMSFASCSGLNGPEQDSNRLRKIKAGPPEIQWSACLGQQNMIPQDAQKVRPARPQRVKGRGVPSGVR